MEERSKEKRPEGLNDPDRAAYMIAWRDRHIEKQNELIRGYEENLSLMEALLAFALWRQAQESEGVRVARIPKKEVSEMLHRYESEVQDGEEEFLVHFRPVQEPTDGGEQDAG